LSCRHGRHALRRDDEAQEHDGEKAEKRLGHWRAIVCQAFERPPLRGFPRTAHLLRRQEQTQCFARSSRIGHSGRWSPWQ
jgi:hypothetical protein